MFRGREVTHPERGVMILDRLAEELADLCQIDQRPIQDGRNMTMVLGPHKKKSEAQAEVKAEKVKSMGVKAAEKEADDAADKAHREAAKKVATPKKPRRRSENLDPDMEA